MAEASAGKAATTVGPDASRADGEWSMAHLPVLRRLAGKSRTARALLSSSPAFRVLMVGSSISMFGSRISTVAFPMLVLHLYNSPFFTGLVAFAAIAPSMLIYVPAGVLVDRWNPRRVMLISELLRGLTIASVVFSLVRLGRHTSIWFLMSAMVAEEMLEIFSVLADRRYLSGLMEGDNMTSRQSYIEVRTHAVILAGRPIGPLLFAIRPILPFLADAVSFLFSVGSLLVVRRSDEPPRESRRIPPRQLAGDIVQGFRWLRNDRRSWVTMILMAVTSLVAQALILMLLVQAHARDLSTVEIGVVLAASGVGGAVGSFSFKFLPDEFKRFWLPIQLVAWSVALASLWLAGGLPAAWSAVAMFTLGFTGAIGNIEFGTYLVANVEGDMIARVTAIGQVFAIGASAVGPVLGGYAIERWGVKGAVEILFVMVAALAFFSLLMPEFTQKIVSFFRLAQRIPLHVNSLPADLPGTMPNLASGRLGQVLGKWAQVLFGKPGRFTWVKNGRP